MTALLEARVALAMPYQRGHALAERTRRRRPHLAGFLVTQVYHFRRGITGRIVAPGRQPILLAVAGPGVPQAALRHQEATQGIGHHVDPRRGREGSWIVYRGERPA